MAETSAPEVQEQPAASAPAGAPQTTPSQSTENGLPGGKALADMSDSERADFWQEQAQKQERRRKADLADAYDGLTPKQVKDLMAKVEDLEGKTMSADEKLLKAARNEAYKQARAEAEAEYLPQIRASQVKSIASGIVNGDQLSAFMDLVDTSKLLGEDGHVSEERVMGYLTALYGDSTPPAGPRHQNFGQYSPPPPRGKPGQAGIAEAQKRFGAKT